VEIDSLHILGYFGALAIGLVLGLVGSGGSLLAVPIFTYLFHISPIMTTSYSLFVVGATSSVGVFKNFKKGWIDYSVAMVIAIPSIFMVFATRKFIVPIIPDTLVLIGTFTLTGNKAILLFFAFLMIIASISMIREKKRVTRTIKLICQSYFILISIGVIIGLLSGIAGIGGGFLIVPALVLVGKLPMRKAVATSLFIISLKSLIGFTGDLSALEINWAFLMLFTLISFLGIFIGVYLSTYIEGENLKKSFGWVVLILAIGMLYKEVFIQVYPNCLP